MSLATEQWNNLLKNLREKPKIHQLELEKVYQEKKESLRREQITLAKMDAERRKLTGRHSLDELNAQKNKVAAIGVESKFFEKERRKFRRVPPKL